MPKTPPKIDLSAGLDPSAPPIDLSAGLEAAPQAKTQEGFFRSLADSFGVPTEPPTLKGAMRDAVIKGLEGPFGMAVQAGVHGAKRMAHEIGNAASDYESGNKAGAAVHAIKAIPVVGPAMDKAADQYANGNYRGEVGTLLGAATQAAPVALGAADLTTPEGPSFYSPMARKIGGNAAERAFGYESPVIPKPLQYASKAAKAIRPVGGIAPGFEENLVTNIPRIKAFAEESGNPLHSQWEFGQAARGAAERGLSHFRENILGPYQGERAPIGDVPNYGGATSGEGSATLGQIEKRISDINDLTRGATKTAKTEGQLLTAQERLGLEEESQALRSKLYNELSKRTGISPDVIRDLRQAYGQQFNIADTVDAARRARLGQTGASAEMGGNTPLTRAGLLDRAIQHMRGGQEYVADARLRRYLKPFDAEEQALPQPAMRDAYQAAANRDAAQAEATRMHESQNTAQDLARERAERASRLRQMRKQNREEFSKLQGETMRAISRKNAANR